jgi:hypothetical protein
MNSAHRDPNPPYGERGSFRKLTVTIPQAVYERLIRESSRRKIASESNQLLSELLREALSEYLDRLDSAGASGLGIQYRRGDAVTHG